jgi:putative glutathione S-transferase
MAIPPMVVAAARSVWRWQWLQLMGGLGPADAEGNYRRPGSPFAQRPALPAAAAEPGGHLLIVGRSCPWAHRAWLTWQLRGLQTSIRLVVAEPDPAAGRWCLPEPVLGCRTLQQLYRRAGAVAGQRATVPVLLEAGSGRILVGESARLIELLNAWPAPEGAPDLEPAALLPRINAWRERFQHAVNDGVYRCGFARNQAAYDRAEAELFAALADAEVALANAEAALAGPWLCGEALTLADVQLFPTLIRLELVYAPLFGVSRRPLWQFPALWRWRARFHALPGVADCCFAEAWRRDYYGALFPLNPSGIVPAAPPLATLVNTLPAAPAP